MRFNAHCAAAGAGATSGAGATEMIALAGSLSVAEIRSEYVEVYRELRENGYTAVGEFHYLGYEEAQAAAEAADEAGIAFVCLYACYLRGGIPRFRQESVAAYLRQLEALRERRHPRRGRPPLRPGLPGRSAARARPLRGGARPAAPRARRRAAARDRGVPRRAWAAADRAARARRLPRPALDDRARHACRRRRARPAA